MDMFVVQGGRRLEGRVAVSGAKNSALPILAASLLAEGPIQLRGVPDLVDVRTMTKLLQSLGMRVEARKSPPHPPNDAFSSPETNARRRLDSGEQGPTAVPHPRGRFSRKRVTAGRRLSLARFSLSRQPGTGTGEIPPGDILSEFDPLTGEGKRSKRSDSSVNSSETSWMEIEAIDASRYVADYELVRRMRASVCVLGPLLARRGRAVVSLPGGCNIGDRPIDLHLKGLAALGAELRVESGYVHAEIPRHHASSPRVPRRLQGGQVSLAGPCGSTVTGTCNVMAAATLARGVTTMTAAAREPEVIDLGNFLNAMGARIQGLGTSRLEIEGVESLRGTTHHVIPDRIEAATLMIAAAATGGTIELENVRLDHLTIVVDKLREIGVEIVEQPATSLSPYLVRVSTRDSLRPADCVALPYPGFPTDLQAQLMALLVRIPGSSFVTDTVFPERFLHAAELLRMGAQLRREGNCVRVQGVERLSGAAVMASDLRASAALVIAALAAEGESTIRRIYHLDRGYERLDDKLNRLGARIVRTSDEPVLAPVRPSVIDPLPEPQGVAQSQ